LKCKICSRQAQPQAQNNYCELHQEAYESLQGKFEDWKRASNIEWKNYLQEVAKNPLTGIWAKEVAASLLSEEN
jgi:hypothetical protein